MKYTLVADTHLYSKYEVPGIRQKVLDLPASRETVLLGDVVDRTCCDKKNIEIATQKHKQLTNLHRDNYLDGNHESMQPRATCLTMNGILFTHGDDEANPTKWRKYREKHKLGAGIVKKLFIMPFVSLFNELVGGKPKAEFFERAASRTKFNRCHTYVCGHLHPKKLIDIKYDGVRIIVVPQGITEIEL